MELFLTGLSHKTAPIEVRERLAFSGESLEVALGRLRKLPGVSETVLVSTCNRTEVYGIASDAENGAAEVADWMGERSAGDLGAHLYRKTGSAALLHLFRMAASLDSMVVGEPQILGQARDAFAAAREGRNAGPRLDRVFTRAFQVARRVRHETGIGESAVSMSFVAVELARKVFGELQGRDILLVGAGKMCELAATHLQTNGVRRVIVANRSPERAKTLAEKYQGEAVPLADVPRLLEEVDIVLSSTAAPGYVITREQMQRALRARRYRPIFLIDLAVPRDIDPAVNDLDQVYAYDVDDMDRVVQENLQQRALEAQRGDRIVRREVTAFLEEERGRSVLPVLAALRHDAREVAAREAEKTLSRLDGVLSDRQRESVEAMAQAIVKKLLHEPTVVLRSSARSGDGERLAAAVVSLFGLDVEATNAAIAEEKARRRKAREARESGSSGRGGSEGDEDPDTDTDNDASDKVVPFNRHHG